MALVRDDCLVPTLDAPELGYVRESTSEQYVPDVFYKVLLKVEWTIFERSGGPQIVVVRGSSNSGLVKTRPTGPVALPLPK